MKLLRAEMCTRVGHTGVLRQRPQGDQLLRVSAARLLQAMLWKPEPPALYALLG